ncbi:MAG TPA: DUF2490 domain-containing protein [Segetibacter sp.]|jgi:hypothetical protein
MYKQATGKPTVLCVFLLFNSLCSYSQSPSGTTGSWLMLFNQTRLHNKWSFHAEAQYRSYELTPNTEQLLVRTGINYHINSSASATVGYANISNYAFDKEQASGVQASENRIWQQLVMRNNIGRFFFEHRYRIEQRWLHSNNNTRYLNRVRYLVRMNVPINKKQIEKNTAFLTFYNEAFLHITSTPFDRNRLYGALGYQVTPNLNLQLGYLAQSVNRTTKHYLQTAFTYNLDLRK